MALSRKQLRVKQQELAAQAAEAADLARAVEARTPIVNQISSRMLEIRETNRFTPTFLALMGERR